MSYILDALRKADAERARGAVPDLHAQPVLRGSAGAAPPTPAQPWVWAAAAMAVTAACGLAWALLTRDAARDPQAAVANVAAPAPLPPPTPTPTPLPTAPLAAQTAAQAAAQAAALPAPPFPVAAPARPRTQASALARPVPEPARPVPRKPAAERAGEPFATAAPATATATAAAPSPPPASVLTRGDSTARPAEPRLYAQAELPDEIRRALPALAIGGAMYSENAASRMLIINGQVFHERDKLAPNLTLVQIRLKTAVLEYRGYRYSVSY